MDIQMQIARTEAGIATYETRIRENVVTMSAARQAYADGNVSHAELMAFEVKLNGESYKIQQELTKLRHDRDAMMDEVGAKRSKTEPTWDTYYWELEHGSQALKWVSERPLANLEEMAANGKVVRYQGSNVTQLIEARIEYMHAVFNEQNANLSDSEYMWAMPSQIFKAWKASGCSIGQWRIMKGHQENRKPHVPKPESWGEFS